jgi:hypothetical protein
MGARRTSARNRFANPALEDYVDGDGLSSSSDNDEDGQSKRSCKHPTADESVVSRLTMLQAITHTQLIETNSVSEVHFWRLTTKLLSHLAAEHSIFRLLGR